MVTKCKYLFVSFIATLLLFFTFQVFAKNNELVIVYPKNNAIINANSTFFIGHTNPKSTFTINDMPVKVYPNGAFVQVVNLFKGSNKVVLKSVLNSEIQTKDMIITVPENKIAATKKEIPQKISGTFTVSQEETPVRISPYGDRLTPAKAGMVVEVEEIINNHYKIKLNDNKFAYISKDAVNKTDTEKLHNQVLYNIELTEDCNNILIKIPLKQPVITEIQNKNNILTVKLFDTNMLFENYIIKSPYIKNFNFKNDTFSIEIASNNINGYDYFYENNTFFLKIKRPFKPPLYGKIIAIDPGHGGSEAGSIGPTEIKEKDINLKISNYLKQELEQLGAKVMMTRNDDSYVDLYERVKIAQKENADILISIHNDALPDGQDPYKIHGTSTYYYQPQAKKLACHVQNNLVKTTGFVDLGIKTGSFVLTRPTTPVSILVEIGFMINPYEYSQLLLAKNQKKYATAIANGVKDYLNEYK